VETHWIPAIIETVAVLLWCGRGLWRFYPAWTTYGILVSIQSLAMAAFFNAAERSGAIWSVFSPFILLCLIDATLELFLRLSRLYRRFQRDRWKWLFFPVLAGAAIGVSLVFGQLKVPSNLYRAMFLSNTIVGSVCGSVLGLCWIASIPVRIPINLRKHSALLAIYIGSSTLAYANYFDTANQQVIRDALLFMPPMVMLAWALLLDPLEQRQAENTESEMPESTLEQILGVLKRLS
jgi:hypothetical protein